MSRGYLQTTVSNSRERSRALTTRTKNSAFTAENSRTTGASTTLGHMFRLRTVRAKLLMLVGLSVLVTLTTLPLLSWLLRKQLLEEVNNNVENAEQAYQAELDDSIVALRLAATALSNDVSVHQALKAGDVKALESMTQAFAKLYPDLVIAFLDKDGGLLARVGCDSDGPPLAARGIVKRALEQQESAGLSSLGCGRVPLPTYFIALPAGEAGAVVVGMDFSQTRLARTGRKLNLELALVDPDGKIVNQTKSFPPGGERIAPNSERLVDLGSQTFAMKPFFPKELASDKKGRFGLVAALDVTQIQDVVRRHLLMALGIVLVAAVIAVAMGLRLASVMSGGLKRISAALGRLQHQQYTKVTGVDTGDELEDLANGFNAMVDGLEERDKLKTTFGKYMTESVVEHIMDGRVPLGGETLTATILFSDIRSFTSISEKMDAKELVGLLNEYFTEMVDVVLKEDGVVDKYIGDAIMAVFGAPVTRKEDALHAVRAAIGMRVALAALNERLVARGAKPIKTGIGIHTGEVVAGNIGSEKRMEYTVIGDTVNLASRLETATKELGVPVLISDDTYRLVSEHIDARPIKEITVHGRDKPVMTYDVIGLKGQPPAPGRETSKSVPPL
jgi:adenylate cyclase